MRQRDDLLGRSRFARDLVREAPEDRGRRSVRSVGRAQEAVTHRRERGGVDADRFRAPHREVPKHDGLVVVRLLLDVDGHMRSDELAAVRDHRVDARELERCQLQVLLTDGKLNRVARLPQAVELPLLRIRLPGERALAPLRGRQQTTRLPGDVDPGRLADPEATRPRLERVSAILRQLEELVAELVEVGVARGLERGHEVHRLVHVRVPVLEDGRYGSSVDDSLIGGRALQRVVRGDDALLHRRQRGDHLERRAGGIETRDRAVERREVVFLRGLRRQPLGVQLLDVDATDVHARLVGRIRGKRPDGAVAGSIATIAPPFEAQQP